jgi:hypothetical protein
VNRAGEQYHGLETTVEKRLSHGAQGSLSYTWSHSIDDVTEQSGTEGNMVVQDWRNIRGDRGNSGFDRRHRLVAHALVDLPFGAGRRWLGSGGVISALLRDWQMSAIVSMQSGAWFDVAILDPGNRLGVTPGTASGGLISSAIRAPSHPTADAWLNAAAFAEPQNADGTYRYGNLGRNSLRRPGYFNLDAALTRDMRSEVRCGCSSGGNYSTRPTTGRTACRTPTSEALISGRSGRPWACRVRCSLASSCVSDGRLPLAITAMYIVYRSPRMALSLWVRWEGFRFSFFECDDDRMF